MGETAPISDKAGSNYEKAGLFLIISGILHLPIPFMAGFEQKSIILAVAGIIWIALGMGLRRKNKFLPCIVYVLMLVGMIASMASLNTGIGPNWLWWLIFLADFLTAFFLFRLIWSKD